MAGMPVAGETAKVACSMDCPAEGSCSDPAGAMIQERSEGEDLQKWYKLKNLPRCIHSLQRPPSRVKENEG